jgi:hypothetical protein
MPVCPGHCTCADAGTRVGRTNPPSAAAGMRGQVAACAVKLATTLACACGHAPTWTARFTGRLPRPGSRRRRRRDLLVTGTATQRAQCRGLSDRLKPGRQSSWPAGLDAQRSTAFLFHSPVPPHPRLARSSICTWASDGRRVGRRDPSRPRAQSGRLSICRNRQESARPKRRCHRPPWQTSVRASLTPVLRRVPSLF